MPLNRFTFLIRRTCQATLLIVLAADGVIAQPKPGMPRAERHESKHEIDQLEQTWRDAILRRNVQAMEALLADDYIAISANGSLQIKAIDFSDRKVRFYGKTALVTSRAEVSGSTGDGELEGSYRYTRVYVRDVKGMWKIVSFEASRIRDPGDHK
jgi:ketosteroid isomerase-like protein